MNFVRVSLIILKMKKYTMLLLSKIHWESKNDLSYFLYS